MKQFFFIALFLSSIGAIGQSTVDNKAFYMMKYNSFKGMKTGGMVMTVAGGLIAGIGIAQISNLEYTTDIYGNKTTNDSKLFSGALLFVGGASLVGGGITLSIIGSNRMKKYHAKLEGLSLDLKINPQQSGLALTYRL